MCLSVEKAFVGRLTQCCGMQNEEEEVEEERVAGFVDPPGGWPGGVGRRPKRRRPRRGLTWCCEMQNEDEEEDEELLHDVLVVGLESNSIHLVSQVIQSSPLSTLLGVELLTEFPSGRLSHHYPVQA